MILILGAIGFAAALYTAPQVVYLEGVAFRPEALRADMKGKVLPVVDVKTAAVRVTAVVGVTALLVLAARSK
jgi:hypothetical protein